MKHYISILAFLIAATSFVGCNSEYTTYTGPEYVGFADTITYCPVLASDEEFEIEVASTTAYDYDRTFGIEVIDAGTNAVEGIHFTLASNSFTIKAGERKAVVKLKGIYNNITVEDNFQVQLRLITPDNLKWELYEQSQDIKVVLIKSCTLDIELFDNRYCVVQSSLLTEFTYSGKDRLIKTYVDRNAEGENILILKNFLFDGDIFSDSYDLRIKFETSNPLTPDLSMEADQIIGNTRYLMGHPYGDTWVRTEMNASYPNYYSACEEFAVIYHRCYVNGQGNMGTFWAILKWISDAEGEYIEKNGF